jgi:hypothetical protein
VGESYREREQRLDRAAKAKFAAGADEYAWVADFTDSQAVIIRNGGMLRFTAIPLMAGRSPSTIPAPQ